MKLEGERDYSETDSGVLAHLKGSLVLKQHLHKVQPLSECL